MSGRKPRIMYIERKAESLNGPARIGRVTFSKTGMPHEETMVALRPVSASVPTEVP